MTKTIFTKYLGTLAAILLVIVLVIFTACSRSSITQDRAEWVAQDFVKKNVKFFAAGEQENKDLPEYTIASITSYTEGRIWVVVLHVESNLTNETKKGDLVVKINSQGKVAEFNGREIT